MFFFKTMISFNFFLDKTFFCFNIVPDLFSIDCGFLYSIFSETNPEAKIATNYFVDPVSGDDTHPGTEVSPKKTIQGAVDLITGVINDVTTIHLKDDTTHYVDSVMIRGIRCIGKNARFVIQTEIWNDVKYEGAQDDPYGTQADFDIKSEKPVVISADMEIEDSTGVELCGLGYNGTTDDAQLKINGQSKVQAKYCRFEGMDASVLSMGGAITVLENSYFLDNVVSIILMAMSGLMLSGNNFIENATHRGIVAMIDSTLWITPWGLHPLQYYITEIKTTRPRVSKYAGIHLGIGSTLFVQSNSMDIIPLPVIGRVAIHHDMADFNSEYYGVIMESKSLLVGMKNMIFTMLNTKSETIQMPESQTIVEKENEGTIVVR